MREYSIPALADIPASANLADIVSRRAAEQPQAISLRRKEPGGGWRDVTAAEFRDEVYGLARGLVAAGIEQGDRVALMSHTRYEWTILDYAIWTAGAVCVPIYETSSAEQAEWILSDSGARAVIVETAGFEQMIADARDRLPGLDLMWRIDPGEPAGSAEPLSALIEGGAEVTDETVTKRAGSADASSLATVIYTSGTTGRPKGCKLTHENLMADVRNAFMGPLAPALHEVPDPSTLLFLPLAHVFARIIEVGFIEAGIPLGHCQNLDDLLPDLAAFKPTFVLAVPRVFEKVYNGAEQRATSEGRGAIFGKAAATAIDWSRALEDGGPGFGLRVRHGLFDKLVYGKMRAALGGRARWAVSGGAALSDRLCHFFRGVGVTVLEGYGLTETTAAASVNRPDRQKIGTVGQPLPGVAIKIADDGEILLSGPTIFPGYWRNDQATADTFAEDRWLRTGDIGELDNEGFLKITGRKKEMIVTAGGKNVAPTVLEDRLRSHALVSQCMVVGDGKPFISALITLDEEALGPWKERHGKPADATPADLREDPDLLADVQAAVDDANKAVSRAESIRKFRVLDTDFTQEKGQLSVKLGIRRSVLQKDFAADIETLYA